MPSQEKVRVIIVDDISETRENIRRMLQFDLNIEVIGSARTGREAIDLCQQVKPDVAVMDINMPDMDGITATQEIKKKQPYIQVVILSVQNDPSYMRKAMLAGARDFLTKPPMIDELTDAVRRAGAMAQEERKKSVALSSQPQNELQSLASNSINGKIITVYSPKGGTGKTTVAVNLAMALKTPENKVALVDGNLQYGDVAVFLNEKAKNTILDLTSRVDDLEEDVVREVMIAHRGSNVHLLAAPPRPEMAEKVTGEQFSKLLRFLRQVYDFIIIDTAIDLNEVVQSALDVTDLIILITTQEIPAIKNASLFLQLADAVGISRNRILFVMNRYDRRITITAERIGETLRQPIPVILPLDEKVVKNSVDHGIPFMLDNNRSLPIGKGVQQLANLAQDRLTKLEQEAFLKTP